MIVCINQKRFEQCLGYGLWGLLTIGLFSLFFVSVVEYLGSTIVQMENQFEIFHVVRYTSQIDGEVHHYRDIEFVYFGWFIETLPFIANLIVILIWIYRKQNKFKIEFCERTGIKHDKQ